MTTEIDNPPTDIANGFSWRDKNGISYLVCEPLERAGFLNAFSSRSGGVSPLPENSLNLSYREDKKENVDENRRRFLNAVNAQSQPLVTAHQIHSGNGITVPSAKKLPVEPECDAMVSPLDSVLFGIQTADCLPVLIGDPEVGVLAAIHAGWRGTMAHITENTIAKLMESLGSQPEQCWVALGPCACGDCYEVGADVVQAFKTKFPESISFFKDFKDNGKALFDVRAANIHQLRSAGVPASQISVSSECTIHDNNLFFSFRVEGKGGAVPVGRQLSIIGRK
jgi:YfiH family protein